MRLKLLLIAVALFVGFGSYGQVTIFSENIGTPTANTIIATYAIGTAPATFQNKGILTYTGVTADVRISTASSGYIGSSGNGNVFITNTIGTDFIISGINTSSYTSLSLSFGHYKSTTASNGSELIVEVSSDGTTYSPLTYSRATGTGTASWVLITPTGTIPSTANLRIRFRQTSSTPQFRIDDIILKGTLAGIISAQTGNWSDTTTWVGGVVPTSADNAIIANTHVVIMDTASGGINTRNSGTTTTVNVGGTLATSVQYINNGTTTINGSFQLNAGGYINSGNNFIYGAAGTLNFNNTSSYGVNNSDQYWPTTSGPFNVNVLQGGVTLNSANRTVAGTFATAAAVTLTSSALTLNGIAQINANGFFLQSPIYGNASTLKYNTGGTFDRGLEWSALGVGTIGTTVGYPNNVQLSGNTTLNYNNGTPLAKAINGNLTIDLGSSFYMDYGGGASGGTLTVAGNLINNGNFTLGNTSGDDLKLGGDFTNNGTFNGKDRAIFFTKNGTQTISSVLALTIPYIVFQPVSGSTTVQLLCDLIVSAPNTGNAISFSSATDVFDLNSKTLTIGSAGVVNVINGSGTFKGSTTSNLTLLGTGSIGTLNFTTGSQVLGNLTLDRQSSNIGFDLGTGLTINGTLTLTNGIANLSNQTMIITLAGLISGASSSNYIIADFTAGGVLRKNFNANGSFTFPIGDRVASADGTQYSPATINFTTANYSSGWVALSIEDNFEPNIDAPTDFITRYWNLTSSGITVATYDFTGTYLPADISGTETNSKSGRYSTSNSAWTDGNNLVSGANTISLTGLTSATGALSSPNHFTASYRNREINIKGLTGGTNNIVSGSTTADSLNNTLFAETNIGSTATKGYEIQNLGIAALNLTGTPIVTIGGANPGDFTVTTAPSLTTITGGSSTSFIITFSPTYAGIRTAVVSIANNDSTISESPYTFLIQGTAICSTTTNTVTPTSGPVGTEVTITATANNLTGATVSFNGVAATSITYVSATQIKVVVPSGATSGNIVVTNALGCTATNYFIVVNNFVTSCQGGSGSSDLFISEVTDATTGGLTYVEIYNGTGSTINLSNYALQTFSNGSPTISSVINLNNVNLTSGSIYVVALGISASPDITDTCTLITGGNGELANQVSINGGINFITNENDHIALINSSTNIKVDSFGSYENNAWASSLGIGDRGVVFRRKNIATLPSATYSNSDWIIINWAGTGSGSCPTNDYTNIGAYSFTVSTPPTVTSHPSYTSTCKATSLTVSGTEGYIGTSPADTKELAYQWLVSAPNALGWTELSNAGIYTGATTATLSISDISEVIDYQYYCQIRENTNTCYSASNSVKITNGAVATWNGSWTNGPPTIDKLVIINADYNTSTAGLDSFSACSVVVNSGKTLTITANEYVKIQNDLTNNGTVNILTDGSLVQVDDNGVNTGNITYERIVPVIHSTDYTYWSSPVLSQNLQIFSPDTPSNKFYSFNAAVVPEDWKNEIPSSVSMDKGVGYCIYGPQLATPPAFFVASFIGKPNNGKIDVPIIWNNDPLGTSNLIGNPYPSAIDADKFLFINQDIIEGTIYFWTHNTDLQLRADIIASGATPGTGALAYTSDDYASYNSTGGTAGSGVSAISDPNHPIVGPDLGKIPNGKIAAGQAFFTTSKLVSGNAIFNNSMRIDNLGKVMDNSQFFKTKIPKTKTTKTIEKHRIWLDLTNTQGVFKQTLVGYITDATNEYDTRFDGESFDGNEFVDFYSINQEKNLVIQGRALPFDENDQVPLGFRTTIEGAFTIKIDQADGVLTNQAVFIEDKLTNTIFDLRSGPYTFNTVAGTFNDRFVLRYTNKTLGTIDLETLENQVLVSNKNKQIKINSKAITIDKVMVYDLLGRLLFKKDKVNSTEFSVLNLISNSETLLVKVTLQNGETVTRKILY